MPRVSTNWSINDAVSATRLQQIDTDLDTLFNTGDDRLKVVKAVSGTALKIDIAAGNYVVGASMGQYAGATDITVTNTATNYVEIDSSGTIQINTTNWTTNYARLATVVCAGGIVTTITIWRSDVVGPSAALSQIGFFGDGSTGTPSWTSGASLDPTQNFEYSAATLPSSQTLTVSSTNTPLILKTTGNVDIEGTVDMNGKGGAGGAATGTGANTSGNIGIAGNSLISGFTNGPGQVPTASAGAGQGGGGGSSVTGNGGISGNNGGGTRGAGGTSISSNQLALLTSLLRGVVCGAGGSSGATGPSGAGNNGAAGGAGGGALVWFIGGNLTLGASSIIRANGVAGSAVTAANSGSGGGGGAGTIIIIVAGSITNSGVTLSATGGAAGTGANSNGGTGSDGKVIIYSLTTGTLITS